MEYLLGEECQTTKDLKKHHDEKRSKWKMPEFKSNLLFDVKILL